MPLISIIVPIYNAEYTLCRCIDSILIQSYTDFELLLIDDGSLDHSGVICDEYATKDRRVRVLHKENGGVSSARNLGIAQAQGEWITFIDSDDYVHTEFLLNLVKSLDAEWILGGYKETKGSMVCPQSYLYRGDEIIIFCNKYNGSHIVRACWGGLYRYEIIQRYKITFSTDIRYGEDTLFNSRYVIYCNSIRVVNDCGYIYCNDTINENKYKLTSGEISRTLSEIIKYRNSLEEIYDLKLEDNSDAIIFLNKYPIDEFTQYPSLMDYYLLCKKCYPNMSWSAFYSDDICSPIIRLISILKRLIDAGEDKEFLRYCEIANIVCGSIDKCPKFKYKDFYIWYFLLKTKNYEVLNFIMNFYFSVKRIIYRIK